jgi:hypothetical protein
MGTAWQMEQTLQNGVERGEIFISMQLSKCKTGLNKLKISSVYGIFMMQFIALA